MKKSIYVYGVQGADFHTIAESLSRALPDYTIKIVDRAALLSADFNPDRVAGFILPGAARGEYDKNIGDDGFAAIKRFVAQGGVFAGFCAGAYYASSKIEWRMDCPESRREKTPGLAFFNGIARGPARQLLEKPDGKWHWGSSSAVDISISGQSKPMKALYWGGPVMRGDFSAYTVLARFSGLPDAPPCLMTRRYGRGRVLLSAIHPEVSLDQLAPFTAGSHDDSIHLKRVTMELAPYENQRKALWEQIVRMFNGKSPALPFTFGRRVRR